MNDIIEDIGNFIFVEDELKKSDIIFVVGGSQPELGEKAAELWHNGYAPLCFVGGGVSIKTGAFPGPKSKSDIYNKKYKTEFDFFTDVLLTNGVDLQAIIGEKSLPLPVKMQILQNQAAMKWALRLIRQF